MKISNDMGIVMKHIDVDVLQKFFDQNRFATDHKTGELLYLDRTVPDNMVWKPAMEKLVKLQQDADRKNSVCIASYVDQNQYRQETVSFYKKKNGQFYEEKFREVPAIGEACYFYKDVSFGYIRQAMRFAQYSMEDAMKECSPTDSFYIVKDLDLREVLTYLEDDVDIESLGLQEPEDFDLQ